MDFAYANLMEAPTGGGGGEREEDEEEEEGGGGGYEGVRGVT